MSQNDLIVRALTLTERQACAANSKSPSTQDAAPALTGWETFFRQSGSDQFDSYLKALPASRSELNQLLNHFKQTEDTTLPDWTTKIPFLSKCFEHISPPPVEAPRAYGHLYRSLYAPLLQQLSERTINTLPQTGLVTLFESLTNRLVQCSKTTLNVAFTEFQSSRQANSKDSIQTIQDQFLAALREGMFHQILHEHPALFRAHAVIVNQWTRQLELFCERFESDREKLMARFFSSEDSLKIKEIHWPISDFHHHGGAGMLITFESGCRVVYKLRSLALDQALKHCLLQLDSTSAPWISIIPGVLDRDTYGWAEFLQTDPGSTDTSPELSPTALGDLLAVAQLFAATDLHRENIGIRNRIPVPWDLETFLRPQFPVGQLSKRFHPDWRTALQSFERSVMGVGLVSQQEKGASIGVSFQHEEDWNQLEHAYRERLQWARLSPTPDLSLLANVPVRYIHRPTAFYHNALQQAWHPSLLKSGVDWEIGLDSLLGIKDPSDSMETWINHAERRALTRLDIPAFTVDNTQQLLKELPSETGFDLDQLDNWTSGHQVAIERWQSLPDETEHQCRFIQFHRDDTTKKLPDKKTPWPTTPHLVPSDFTTAIEQFSREAEGFIRSGHRLSAGTSQSGAWRLAPATPGFYQGSTGLALFWGAASQVMSRPDWAELAKQAVAPLLHDLNDPFRKTRLTGYLSFGGSTGILSVLYCLGLLDQFLSDASLQEAQGTILQMDFRSYIASDRSYDIISGSAGAILCWLASYRRHGIPEALRWAEQAAQHMIKHHPAPTKETSRDKQPLAGVSHGASGFALALARLAASTNKSEYLDEAKAWLAYEDQLFIPETGHWQDLRDTKSTASETPMCAWCNGAAGIALARQTIAQETGLTIQHIDESAAATLNYPIQEYQHTCCGNFGRIEILNTLAQDRNQSEWENAAKQRASYLLQRNQGAFRWRAGRNQDNLGFFTGISGIAYSLIRLNHPRSIPCPLRWD